MSPGKTTATQRIATRERTVAPFVFEVIGSLAFPEETLRTLGGTASGSRLGEGAVANCWRYLSSSVSSTTSSFVLRRRAHNVDTWFFLLAPRLYRRLHRARNVSRAEFGQLDKLAGMRWDPTLSSIQALLRPHLAGGSKGYFPQSRRQTHP